MAKRPKKPDYARADELLAGVIAAFDRLIRRGVARRVTEERMDTVIPEEFAFEFAQEIGAYLGDLGFTPDIRERTVREARRRLLTEPKPTELEDAVLEDELARTAMVLALIWIDLLHMAADGPEGRQTLRAADIGDDMLPRTLTANQLAALDEALGQTVVTPDELRRYLTFIRGAEGGGAALLPAVVELLGLDGITVVPALNGSAETVT